MLDFTKLWDKTYLLGPNPIELQRSDQMFFVVSLAFILVSLLAKIFSYQSEAGSPKRFLLSRFFHVFLTSGALILLWFGSRFENIPMLSAHITVLLLLVIWLVWLIFIAKYFFKEYRVKQKQWEEEKVKRKYLARAS
ncbi:MAG: hypothetical protein U1C57_00590 [Candidatus Doudnabacteria bacterium]|nr:hypothetical protein [bacterium]MDZ4243586.1 hypothetical protein [Candidatus Doudnabacteria bacterium]